MAVARKRYSPPSNIIVVDEKDAKSQIQRALDEKEERIFKRKKLLNKGNIQQRLYDRKMIEKKQAGYYSREATLARLRRAQASIDPIDYYRLRPMYWIEDWLGIPTTPWYQDIPPKNFNPKRDNYPLWSKQVYILDKFFKHKKVAVKSAFGVGKTFVAALAALTVLCVYQALVITTAPTFRQVEHLLWNEIHRAYYNANAHLSNLGLGSIELGGKLTRTNLKFAPKWYATGFATRAESKGKETAYFQGYHDEFVCLIFDEACGVPNQVYEAADAILTSQNTYVMFIGNPTDPASTFAKYFNHPRAVKKRMDAGEAKPFDFYPITISSYQTPNVRHNKMIYPALVSPDWVKDKEEKWGEKDFRFHAKVLAKFPEGTIDTLIPLSHIDAAMERELKEDDVKCLAVDVAREGDDSSVIGVRYNSGKFRILEVSEKQLTTETVGKIKKWYHILAMKEFNRKIDLLKQKMKRITNPVKKEEIEVKIHNLRIDYEEGMRFPDVPIIIDDIGVGGGVFDMLLEDDYFVVSFKSSRKAFDPEEQFENRRAEAYWSLKLAFSDGRIDIDDDELATELNAIKIHYTRMTKIKVREKSEIKKEVGNSPDKADTAMIAFSDEAEISIEFWSPNMEDDDEEVFNAREKLKERQEILHKEELLSENPELWEEVYEEVYA